MIVRAPKLRFDNDAQRRAPRNAHARAFNAGAVLSRGLMPLARAVVAATTLFVGGCGTATFIVQQYEGDPRPSSQISVLRVNGSNAVRLEELDGEVLAYELHERGARVHIEMQPGEHELGLADGAGLPIKRRRFVAEPGKVYRPMVFHTDAAASQRLTRDAWVVAIYEVDPDSDEILREISQVHR